MIGLTIQQWRSLRRNRKCMYCVHAHTVYGRDGSICFCRAKEKLVYEGLPRWFCPIHTVEDS